VTLAVWGGILQKREFLHEGRKVNQRRRTFQDLTEEYYRRWCTLQNSAFDKALKEFSKRWESEPDLWEASIVVARKAERGKGIVAIQDQQQKQGQFLSELIKVCNAWPSITPGDVLVIEGALAFGPKVRLAPYSPVTWPRDGSLLLYVHPTATGDAVESAFQMIKREIAPKKRDRRKRSQKKVSVQNVNLEPGKESIILRVEPTATGKHVKNEFQSAKKVYWPRRHRKGTRRLKVEIYNLYRQGTTFQHIAYRLGISRPTVYDYLRAVAKDIGEEAAGGKPAFPGWDDWEKNHKPGCPSCRKGHLCRSWAQSIGLPSPNPFLRRGKRPPKIHY
jgi:hypothetical protein